MLGVEKSIFAQPVSALEAEFEDNFGDPTMLGPDELALYHAVGKDHAGGDVIEIGSWLGGGTRAACLGLCQTDTPWTLYAIDKFVWSKALNKRYEGICEPGTSFLPRFRANVAEFGDKVVALQGDYSQVLPVPPGNPQVRTLLIDGPRSWHALRKLLTDMAPTLRPGSRIAVQGLFHLGSIDMAFLMAQLPLRMERYARNGAGAVYLVEANLEKPLADLPAGLQQVEIAAIRAAFERVLMDLSGEKLTVLVVALCLELLGRGDGQYADEMVARYLGQPAIREEAVIRLQRLLKTPDAAARGSAMLLCNALRLRIPLRGLARPERDSKVRADMLEGLGGKEIFNLGRALGRPQTARELATLFLLANPDIDRAAYMAHFPLFTKAAQMPDLPDLLKVRGLVMGRTVVDFHQPGLGRGVILRSFGARHYTGAVGAVADMGSFPGVAFAEPEENEKFDVGLDSYDSSDILVERILQRFNRIDEGGKLVIIVRNIRSVPVHGGEAEWKAWSAGLSVMEALPKIADIQDRLGAYFEIFLWEENFAPPDLVARIEPSLARRHMLQGPDLAVRNVHVGIVRKPGALEGWRSGAPYARRRN